MANDNLEADLFEKGCSLYISFDYSEEKNLREMIKGEVPIANQEEILSLVDKAKEIGKEIEQSLSQLISKIQERLAVFIPDFKFGQINLHLGFFNMADFRTDGDTEIYVDLLRLTRDSEYIDTFTKGLTHEIFHNWLTGDGQYDWSAENPENVSLERLRTHILFRIIDEGFAVFVGEQSLPNFYKRKGLEHEQVLDKGEKLLKIILNSSDEGELSSAKKEGFDSMGPLYALGYKIVNDIYQYEGQEGFNSALFKLKRSKDPGPFFNQ